MSEHWRRRVHGRPSRDALERDTGELPGPDVEGWRREHVHRALAAVQATAVFAVMLEALAWREDLQEGLGHKLRHADLSVF